MRLFRRAIYLHALAWFLVGAILALYPRAAQVFLGQPEYVEHAWVRLFGVQAVGLALVMVLVGHRAEELWWWGWAVALSTGAVAAVCTLNAAFGVPAGGRAAGWWGLAIGAWGLGSFLLLGMQRAAAERPPEAHPVAPARDPHPKRRRR